MGRPALTDEQVRSKLLEYCDRYGVSPGPQGLPPFPSGRRESLQHREWLAVYRALQRLRARSADAASKAPAGACPICSRPPGVDDVAFTRPGRSKPDTLHAPCADLARLAVAAGPDAVSRLTGWLWPRRGRGAAP
jgi:hypothetical protein